MPAFETMDLQQTAVLWSATGSDNYNRPTVSAPREVRCRWVWKRTEIRTATGGTIALDARVTLAEEVDLNTILWLGSLADLSGTGTSETPDSDIMKVLTKSVTPDIKNRNKRYDYGLARTTDEFPALG